MAYNTISLGSMVIRQYGPGNFTSVTSSAVKQFRRTVSKTDTVRRPKPSPLSIGVGTSYDHSDDVINEAYTQIRLRDPDRLIVAPVGEYVSAGAPLYSWASMSNTIGGKLRAKIKSQNLNLAQSVAEYRQTSSMFANAARDVSSTFRSLRRGRAFADFIRLLQRPRNRQERALANRWLEYQYGLKPLISDIYGATDSLVKRLQQGCYMRVSATHSVKSNIVDLTFSPTFGVTRREWDVEHTARGVGDYTISAPWIKDLAQNGISNPLLLGWELIPFSFVVDWLFPVGQFISSLDSLNGVSNFRWVYSEQRRYDGRFYVGSGMSSSFGRRSIRNAPSTSVPLPSLGYKPSTSLTSVLNGLALLSQIRAGR